MTTDYSLPGGQMRRVRDLAKQYRITTVTGYDETGKMTIVSNKPVMKVVITFSRGEAVTLKPLEYRMLRDVIRQHGVMENV